MRYSFFICVGSLLLIAAVVFLLLVGCGPIDLARSLTDESGVVENLSAAAYFGALIVCVYRLLADKVVSKRYLVILWSAALFLFLGEETSWLQHFFSYGSPEFFKDYNFQREVNLHNLSFWNAPAWLGCFRVGDIDYRIFFSSANLFRVAFTLYFLIFPILCHVVIDDFFLRKRLYVVLPDRLFLAVTWLVIGLSILMTVYGPIEKLKPLSETREMLYAFVIFFYCTFYLKNSCLHSCTL